VRASIGARFAEADAAERVGLAHAWLAGRLPDEAILHALEQETDAEVFAVLAAAAVAHRLESDPALLGDRLADPRTRQAALALLGAASARDSAGPRVRRAVARALSDPDPSTRAAAFQAARGLPAVIPHGCAALAAPTLALRRAAWASLPPDAPCLTRRARVDRELRAWRSQARTFSADGGLAVVRVVESSGRPLPRVSIVTDDGRWLVLRPPAHGVVALPDLAPSTVRVVLDEEPVPARER